MPRFRLDDAFAFHPKVVAAGNAAVGAWVRMGTHCAANLTDGFVSDRVARLIANEDEIGELLAAQMLVKEKGGYCIHDYLAHQMSKQDVEQERADARERMRRKRKDVRANFERTSEEVPGGEGKGDLSLNSGSEGEGAGRGLPDGMTGDLWEGSPRLPLPGKPTAVTKRVVDRWRSVAETVLEAVNAARKRVHPKSRGIGTTYDSLRHIAERLEAGKSAEDCLHVVEVCEAECRANANAFQWFNAVTPFVVDNFERKSAADPGMITKLPPATRQPHEPSRPKPPPFRKPVAMGDDS